MLTYFWRIIHKTRSSEPDPRLFPDGKKAGHGQKKIALACGLLMAVLCLAGCERQRESFLDVDLEGHFVNTEEKNNKKAVYPVVLVDSVFYQAEEAVCMAGEGEDISFRLMYEPGFTFASCDYPSCRVEEGEKDVILTLEDVREPVRVTVTSQKAEEKALSATLCTLTYDPNGGMWTGEREAVKSPKTETTSLSYHIRPNTRNGSDLVRDGYTLTGWNTEKNGSGKHIGLGSRTDPEANVLYAEWTAWTDPSFFTFRRNETGVTITGYKGPGDLEKLVIPARLDGLDVTEMAGSFTTNMPCKTMKARALILPDTLRSVEGGAFSRAEFEELFFFDSLMSMGESAFKTPVRTIHIQAALPPVYQKNNANARFADNLDRLMLAQGRRKLAFFAGCSLSYGLNSPMIAESYPNRQVFNLGVIGGINARYQMDIISCYLEEGDVFVHAPEEMGPAQLYYDISCDYRMLITVEGNYDLLSLADLSYAEDFWKAYNTYARMRMEEEAGSYEDFSMDYNSYGDILLSRPYTEDYPKERDVSYNNGEYVFSCTYLTDRGMDRLCGMYDTLKEKGVTVCISYAPVNVNGLPDTASAREFETLFTAMLKERGWQPVSLLEDYLLEGRYFYDSDYHLNEYGALLRTKQLLQDLSGKLEE